MLNKASLLASTKKRESTVPFIVEVDLFFYATTNSNRNWAQVVPTTLYARITKNGETTYKAICDCVIGYDNAETGEYAEGFTYFEYPDVSQLVSDDGFVYVCFMPDCERAVSAAGGDTAWYSDISFYDYGEYSTSGTEDAEYVWDKENKTYVFKLSSDYHYGDHGYEGEVYPPGFGGWLVVAED